MATVRPFRGIVFDATRINDAAAVTCPPYDVISPADRDRLYERHPYNFVRVVSGREEPDDTDRDNKYTRASGFFRSWLWEGVLRRDPDPAVYVYRQAFTDPTGRFRRVWGLLATISLDDEILAHEQTMSGPKADRLALMEHVPANPSPIYALYSEPGGSVAASITEVGGSAPLADFADDDGTRHTVWPVHDPGFHDRVAKALAPSPILIADGHHRFATAQRYREQRGDPGPWDEIMTLLVDAASQPVCILPYHRMVLRTSVPDPLAVLGERFTVTALGPYDDARADALGLELWQEDRPGVFVAFAGGEAFRLEAPGVPDNEIPAATLKRLALEPLGARHAEDALAFTPRAAEVGAEVGAGRAVCGFLMQPVHVDRVWRLAESGATMPEKSTYFHPKPRDGIVIRSLEA